MPTPMILAACCVAVVALAACDRDRISPPLPRVNSLPTAVPTAIPSAIGPATAPGAATVPAADTVFSPATEAAKAASSAERTNKSMTKAEERNAMPMAGQNNDHSSPSAATTRASGVRP